jgi:hypothetical protein
MIQSTVSMNAILKVSILKVEKNPDLFQKVE